MATDAALDMRLLIVNLAVHEAARIVLSGPDASGGPDGAASPAAGPVSIWADGEYVGLLPAVVTVAPGALTAFVPGPETSEKIG